MNPNVVKYFTAINNSLRSVFLFGNGSILLMATITGWYAGGALSDMFFRALNSQLIWADIQEKRVKKAQDEKVKRVAEVALSFVSDDGKDKEYL